MPDTKISAMPAATSLTGSELVPIVQGGVNKSAATNLFGSLTAWGSITGTLSSQTDLQTALNAKAALAGSLSQPFNASQLNVGANATSRGILDVLSGISLYAPTGLTLTFGTTGANGDYYAQGTLFGGRAYSYKYIGGTQYFSKDFAEVFATDPNNSTQMTVNFAWVNSINADGIRLFFSDPQYVGGDFISNFEYLDIGLSGITTGTSIAFGDSNSWENLMNGGSNWTPTELVPDFYINSSGQVVSQGFPLLMGDGTENPTFNTVTATTVNTTYLNFNLTNVPGVYGGLYSVNGGGANSFNIHGGTDVNLSIQDGNMVYGGIGSGVAFSSINDAGTANLPMQFRASEFNLSGWGGSGKVWSNNATQDDGSGNMIANAFKTNGGTGTMFVKGDGTLDGVARAPVASPVFSGTVVTPALNISGQTASTIALFDASKNVVSAATATYPSPTELSYVKGVTSSIQTQLGTKLSTTAVGTSTQFVYNNSGAYATSALLRQTSTTALSIGPTSGVFTLSIGAPLANTTVTGTTFTSNAGTTSLGQTAGLATVLSINSSGATLQDGCNLYISGATSGSMIATSSAAKMAFWGATPVVQQSGNILNALKTTGLVATPTLGGIELDYISGMLLGYSSTTAITVSAGNYYDNHTSTILSYSGGTISPTLAASKFYCVYCYNNSGTATIDVQQEDPPSTAYYGTARQRATGNQGRYLGSFLTNASSQIINFRSNDAGKNLVELTYIIDVTSAPFRILSGGTASSFTQVSAASCIPRYVATDALVIEYVTFTTTGGGGVNANIGIDGTGITGGIDAYISVTGMYPRTTQWTPIEQSTPSIYYRVASDGIGGSGPAMYIDVCQYKFNR